ncbi:MAG: SDR family oxidoreductase [Planctomycetes bacterium]|nr:SDR family oxidoreductase [Planctomycetota bacterium]
MDLFAVTGGAGFIGSHIVDRFLEEKKHVRVIDNFATGRPENLREAERHIEFFKGDICDGKLLKEAFAEVEIVFHQAALASVQRSVENPVATNRTNVEGTVQVLEAARKCGVKRVVYASSSSVYGDKPTLPKREDMSPSPRSPYAISKLAAEQHCTIYPEIYGLETVALRYFNVFGPRQNPKSQYAAVIPIFISALLSGEQPVVFGDGEQSRDFTFVENVVEANLRAAVAPAASGGVYNVGCGERFSLNSLLEMLSNIMDVEVNPQYESERSGDVRHSEADITRASEELGYEPQVTFQDGLQQTVRWFQQNM